MRSQTQDKGQALFFDNIIETSTTRGIAKNINTPPLKGETERTTYVKGDVKMGKKDEEKLLKLFGARGTKQILEFLSEHDTGQYKQMKGFTSTPALNRRLRGLLVFNLIEHHFEREEGRKEWYSITEKGEKLLKCMRAIIEVAEE